MRFIKQKLIWIVALAFTFIIVGSSGGDVFAAQLTARSITLGSSAPSASTTHAFAFTTATTNDVGSIIFDYCTTASGACSGPTGLDVDSATLSGQTGATGFVKDATPTDTNTFVIDRTPASISASTAVTYTLSSAVNNSTANQTFFIRISTTDAEDGGGSTVDTGVVAASTAAQITVSASVDETLTFCTGTSGITSSSCASATGTSVSLGTLTTTSTGSSTSQIGVTTNASSGYSVTVNGNTLTSGGNTISALASQTASSQGSEQFGINLKDNATPNVGSEVAGAGDGTATANYGTADQYRFVSGDSIASDAEADDFRLYTVSYIANIANSTEPGTYQTTLTYICTATF